MVLTRPRETDGFDSRRGGEGIDVVRGKVREIAQETRHLGARESPQGPREVGKKRDRVFEGPRERERVVADERAVHEKDEARPSAPHTRAKLLHVEAPFRGPLGGEARERDPGWLEPRRDDRFGRRRPRRAQSRDGKRISGAESDEAANDTKEKD